MEPLRKTEAGGAIHLQRIQIPGVHLNDPCPGLAGKGEIGLIEDLNHASIAVCFRCSRRERSRAASGVRRT